MALGKLNMLKSIPLIALPAIRAHRVLLSLGGVAPFPSRHPSVHQHAQRVVLHNNLDDLNAPPWLFN